jgi:hypothetical protein
MIPKIPNGVRGDGVRLYRPGAPGFAPAVLGGMYGGNAAAELTAWVNVQAAGQDVRKDITIEVRDQRGEAVRTFNLHDCFPIRFEPVSVDVKERPGGASSIQWTLEVRVNRITMASPATAPRPRPRSDFEVQIVDPTGTAQTGGGWRSIRGGGLRIHESASAPPGAPQEHDWENLTLTGAMTADRKDMLQWYTDMVETGQDARRMVTFRTIERGGTGRTIDYLDCFLTGYTLGSLDPDTRDEPTETIEICVGHSDSFLG